VPGFNFTAANQSSGGNLGDQQVGKSAAQLAALCSNDTACKGFTSSGWLKSSIKVKVLWVPWSGTAPAGPCDGMFVKDGVVFEGEIRLAIALYLFQALPPAILRAGCGPQAPIQPLPVFCAPLL